MKKIFLIFAGIAFVAPAMAEGELQLQPTTNIVTTSYVRGAYNTLDAAKQEKLTSVGDGANVSDSGTGPYVAGVSASNGMVYVSKSEITIPVGNPQTPTGRATIWVE